MVGCGVVLLEMMVYGRFWVKDPVTGKGSVYRAHRFAMQLVMSRELEAREYVLHRCDNPLCVKATGDDSTHVWLGGPFGEHG